MQITAKTVGAAWAKVCINAANGGVHPRQFPRGEVGFLAVHRDVANTPAMFLDEK
jgi:hypothetical protein